MVGLTTGSNLLINSVFAATANNTNTSESWGTHDSGLARDLDDKEMDEAAMFGSPQVSLRRPGLI